MRFTSIVVLASFAASSLASTVADVKRDITRLAANLTTYDTSVNAFPTRPDAGTNLGFNRIHLSVETFGFAMKQAIDDVKNLGAPISQTDSKAIVDSLLQLEKPALTSLDNLIARKASILALSQGGSPPRLEHPLRRAAQVDTPFETARKDLVASKDLVNQFATALTPALAANQRPRFRQLATRINQGLDRAITAFSSTTNR